MGGNYGLATSTPDYGLVYYYGGPWDGACTGPFRLSERLWVAHPGASAGYSPTLYRRSSFVRIDADGAGTVAVVYVVDHPGEVACAAPS